MTEAGPSPAGRRRHALAGALAGMAAELAYVGALAAVALAIAVTASLIR